MVSQLESVSLSMYKFKTKIQLAYTSDCASHNGQDSRSTCPHNERHLQQTSFYKVSRTHRCRAGKRSLGTIGDPWFLSNTEVWDLVVFSGLDTCPLLRTITLLY